MAFVFRVVILKDTAGTDDNPMLGQKSVMHNITCGVHFD